MNIKLKSLLLESQSKKLIVYHGTNSKFSNFDFKQTAQGIIWFSSNKERILAGESGANGTKYILTCEININNPAGWDEYDKYSLFYYSNQTLY